ncbi:MAG TPA: DUF664 domain-containing protein [Acidimicrobiales bacterium]|nr:DUF664 domain-containing protein [Acidimicrobiales bacterium]
MSSPSRRADIFVDPENDPREGGPTLGDERATLVEYLRCQRATLELKCSGLDATDLARRSVEPSILSLLGLVRHMADVERCWFRQRLAGQDAPPHFSSGTDPDGDFDGAVPDPEVVAEAWDVWRAEVAFTDRFVAEAPDLDLLGNDPRQGRSRCARCWCTHGGGVRPAQRPRRPAARADRRRGGPVALEVG